jgi:N-methylhydantoinase B
VALDVAQGKVSREAAERDYGVVLGDAPGIDEAATATLRARLAAERGEPPMFDRGPGYPRLSGGATRADVDT